LHEKHCHQLWRVHSAHHRVARIQPGCRGHAGCAAATPLTSIFHSLARSSVIIPRPLFASVMNAVGRPFLAASRPRKQMTSWSRSNLKMHCIVLPLCSPVKGRRSRCLGVLLVSSLTEAFSLFLSPGWVISNFEPLNNQRTPLSPSGGTFFPS